MDEEKFVLYKPPSITLAEMRVDEGRHPEELYIRNSERVKGVQEAQKGFNRQLEEDIKKGNVSEVKENLVNIVGETFLEPRSGSLEGVSETVSILVSDDAKESLVIKSLIDMSFKDYSTVLHSVNTMAFALTYASYLNYPRMEVKKIGLCALLHDVGKTKLSENILNAPRRLTEDEFEEMKSHAKIGHDILKQCKFRDEDISICALEHHEKLDGSGYPDNKRDFSPLAQLIGIIDSFEALTTDERPYRQAMKPFDVFSQIIQKDVKKGKFSKELYFQFIKSLGL